MNAKQQVSDDSLFGISGGLPNDSYNQVRTPYSATLHILGKIIKIVTIVSTHLAPLSLGS